MGVLQKLRQHGWGWYLRCLARWNEHRKLARAIASTDPPILIYQMGKVASSTIQHALERLPGLNVFHVHYLNPAQIDTIDRRRIERGLEPSPTSRLGRMLYRHFIQTGRPTRVITLVREPIGRNISAYFQNLAMFRDDQPAPTSEQVDQLIHSFLVEYPHQQSVTWFDLEFKAVLGIDVYEYPFSHEMGYGQITTDKHDVLILRHDLPDEQKAAAVARFLQLSTLTLTNRNVSAEKTYGQVYKQFLASVQLPVNFIDQLLNTRYTRHFYSAQEIEKFRASWTSAAHTRV